MNIGSYFQQFKKLFFNLINRIRKIFNKNTDINHQSYSQSSESQGKIVKMQKENENISHEKSNSNVIDNIPSDFCPTVDKILDYNRNAQISCVSLSFASLEYFSPTANDGVKICSLSKSFHFGKVTTLNKIDHSCVYFGKVTENSYTYNVYSKLWNHNSINAASTFNQANPAMHFQSSYDAHNSSYCINQQVTGGNNWVFGEGESSDFTSFIGDDDSLDGSDGEE